MSKQVHYHKYFEENQKNYRALWIGINEIVYCRNKTFQQFLHKYWQKITKQIVPTKKYFSRLHQLQ